STVGAASFLFYLIVYTLMTVGAFAVLLAVAGPGEEWLDVESYAGLGWRHPLLGVVMTVFLLSLAGFPFTGGFIGKVFILRAAVEKHFVVLAVVMVLASLISYWYYLRVAWYMWFREAPAGGGPVPVLPGALKVALVVSAALVVLLGIFPGLFLGLAQQSAASLLPAPGAAVGLLGR
ncbi:MAG TPA: proton-conducting transporter membrane subunit, partial [Longimicrobiales bacterium]